MSASTLIVDQENYAALVTDTACYDANGVILYFKRKVVVSEDGSWAASVMGRMHLLSALEELRDLDFDEALREMPALLRRYLGEMRPQAPGDIDGKVMVGGWSAERGRWTGCIFLTAEEAGFAPFVPHFTILAMAPSLIVGGREVEDAQEQITRRLASGGPRLAAEYILAGQRPHDHYLSGARRIPAVVGGSGELTLLQRGGVSTEVVVEWPDQVGDGPDARQTLENAAA